MALVRLLIQSLKSKLGKYCLDQEGSTPSPWLHVIWPMGLSPQVQKFGWGRAMPLVLCCQIPGLWWAPGPEHWIWSLTPACYARRSEAGSHPSTWRVACAPGPQGPILVHRRWKGVVSGPWAWSNPWTGPLPLIWPVGSKGWAPLF